MPNPSTDAPSPASLSLRHPWLAGALGTAVLSTLFLSCLGPVEITPPPDPAARTMTPRGALALPELAVSRDVGSLGVLSVASGSTRPLATRSLDVDVTLVGRLARTEVRQVFVNPTGQRLEGLYTFTLPEGATISRLAMDVNGEMTEGELVERERARTIYEGIVRKQRDPALLQWQGGQRFQMRIFPIEPNSQKTVVVAYEQVLPSIDGQIHYRYALPELPEKARDAQIDHFRFAMTTGGVGEPSVYGYAWRQPDPRHIEIERTDFLPAGPIDLRFDSLGDTPKIAYGTWQGERFFALEVTPRLPPAPPAPPAAVILALDTSASLGKHEVARIAEAARTWVATWSGPVAVLTDDGACPEAGFATAQAVTPCLDALTSGGGTDLAALLRRSGERAQNQLAPERHEHTVAVILFSDGVPSLGELRDERLVPLADMGPKVALHTVAVGPDADLTGLAAMARAGRGHALRLNPAAEPTALAPQLQRAIAEPVVESVAARLIDGQVSGLTPWQPIHLTFGESAVVLGRLDSPTATVALEGRYTDQPFSSTWKLAWPADAPDGTLLAHFWARATLEAMQAGDAERAQVVEVSRHYGVMSPYTSFLVLEGQTAYDQYAVERRKQGEVDALADALTPERTPIATNTTAPATDSVAAPEIDLGTLPAQALGAPTPSDAVLSGAGGLGVRGGGIGAGAGGIGGGGIGALGTRGTARPSDYGGPGPYGGPGVYSKHDRMAPRISVGAPQVMGSLDKEIIRRIIRRHQNELRYCYERVLVRNPTATGKLVVKFVINQAGEVPAASITSSSFPSSDLGSCVVSRMRRWRFPSAPAGIVVVTYPFIFTTDGIYGGMSYQQQLELQRKEGTLSLQDGYSLLDLYVQQGQRAAALTLYRELATKIRPADGPWAPLELAQQIVALEPSALVRQARRVIDANPVPAGASPLASDGMPDHLVRAVIGALPARRRAADAAALFARASIEPAAAAWLLEQLLSDGAVEKARALVATWSVSATPDARLTLLGSSDRVADTFAQEVFDLTATEALLHDTRAFTWSRMIRAALATRRPDEAARLVLAGCDITTLGSLCETNLRALGDHPAAKERLRQLLHVSLDSVIGQRSQDIGNLDLIERHASLLDELGQPRDARRILEEAVEFAPHDANRRVEVARRLAQRGHLDRACEHLVVARQLDPQLAIPVGSLLVAPSMPSEALFAAQYSCLLELAERAAIERDLEIFIIPRGQAGWLTADVVEPSGATVRAGAELAASGAWMTQENIAGGTVLHYTVTVAPKGTYTVQVQRSSGQPGAAEFDLVVIHDAGSRAPRRETKTLTSSGNRPTRFTLDL